SFISVMDHEILMQLGTELQGADEKLPLLRNALNTID
ncbi:hypothetical protein NPIL_400651, partial [Nephila pilipes]